MIKSLHIKNYLSHKDTFIEFHPGSNVIIGLSDAGKSAVMNALYWVLFNQPLGDDFRSWWGGDTSVKVELDNGTVERVRKTGFNGYILNNKGRFEAIKSGIPDEIANVLNINDVNFQQQLDSHFLLSKTSGEVAKYFNKIARLDKIDLSTSNINSWISTITQTIRTKQDDFKKKVDELKTYNYLEQYEEEVVRLETLQKTHDLQNIQAENLNTVLTNLENIQKEIDSFQKILSIEKQLDEILDKITTKNKLEEDYDKLCNIIESIESKQQKIKSYECILTQESNITKISQLYSDKNILKMLFINTTNVILKIKVAESNFKSLHEKFDKEMGDMCLLCGTKIK
jgi:exonuclease SbcC